MTLTSTPAPGVEVWSCSQCTRRLLLRRPPDFKKTVLEPGDESSAHVGGTGGLRPTTAQPSPALSSKLPADDRSWLARHGISWDQPDDPRSRSAPPQG